VGGPTSASLEFSVCGLGSAVDARRGRCAGECVRLGGVPCAVRRGVVRGVGAGGAGASGRWRARADRPAPLSLETGLSLARVNTPHGPKEIILKLFTKPPPIPNGTPSGQGGVPFHERAKSSGAVTRKPELRPQDATTLS